MARGDAGRSLLDLLGAVGGRLSRGGRKTTKEVVQSATGRVTRRAPTPPRKAPRKPTTPRMAERLYEPPTAAQRTATTGASRTTGRAARQAERRVAATRKAAAASTRRPSLPSRATQRVAFGKNYPTMSTAQKVGKGVKRGLVASTLGYTGLLGTDKVDLPSWLRGGGNEGYSFDPGTGTTTFTDAAGNIFAVDPTTGEMTQVGTDPQQAALAQMSEDWREAQLGNYPGSEGELTYGEEGFGGEMGDYGYGGDYSGLRANMNALAQNLRGYGTAKGTGMRNIYGELSEEAAADAIKAEAIARAAYEDIGRIGRDYSAGATADITSPGAGGPTELTGLTPVTGESYDIPGRIADTSQIAADYVLRDLNLTRDDLNYMSGMAKMMGPAYEAQLNDAINLAIANKMFELEQYIAGEQGTDRRLAAEQAALDRRFAMEQQALTQRERDAAARQAWADFYERESARQGILGGTSQLSSDQYIIYLTAFEDLNKTEKGRQTLRGLGIDPNDPNAFQKFLAREQRIAAGQVAGS